MIRYSVTEQDIQDAIGTISDSWLTRARERTQTFIDNGTYDESSSIWSDVKPVYIALQNDKCVFCERKFETVEYGKIEYDLEHFRPKSSVVAWPRRRDGFTYDFATGGAAPGYHWLAYDLLNYAASCKVCNSTLKSNCFPIAGDRGAAADRPNALAAERPFLCYPLTDLDDDPESLVTFTATIAVPAARDGHERRRGQVIIDFFRLNHREHLHQERAKMIMILGDALIGLDQGDDVALNREIVDQVTGEAVSHTSCSRAFRDLWGRDPDLARHYHRQCRKYFAGLIGIDGIA